MSFRSYHEDLVQDKDAVLSHRKLCKRRSSSTPMLYERKEIDINTTDCKGRTSLYYAVKYGEKEMARHLLKNGADPNIPDNALTFPIHEAIDNAYLDIVQLLIDYDCDLNCKNLLGQTPLIRCTLFGDEEACKMLIKYGADLDDIECTGKTALLVGLREGNDKICSNLIRQGCDINSVDSLGQSALFLAVHRSSEPSLVMCQKLYKAGYDFENDCNWLSKNLYKRIIHTGIISTMLTKLGIHKIKVDHDDAVIVADMFLEESCARVI